MKKLSFDESTRLANCWNIANGVVVNPEICFGQPILREVGIPTGIIADAVRTNGKLQPVADWFGISVAQVRYAVRFEHHRQAA